ncbi:DUF6894 family protein [Microvirga lupini]|uniref:DUF6894 family protein n=1 Tax=Microvirga lupini TaxID=420324 RepID=UPI003CCE3850
MPRYFFHISDGRRTYPDPLGVALPSLRPQRLMPVRMLKPCRRVGWPSAGPTGG